MNIYETNEHSCLSSKPVGFQLPCLMLHNVCSHLLPGLAGYHFHEPTLSSHNTRSMEWLVHVLLVPKSPTAHEQWIQSHELSLPSASVNPASLPGLSGFVLQKALLDHPGPWCPCLYAESALLCTASIPHSPSSNIPSCLREIIVLLSKPAWAHDPDLEKIPQQNNR